MKVTTQYLKFGFYRVPKVLKVPKVLRPKLSDYKL